MARSKSSKRWLKEHFSDPFVKKAQQAGYRSRAVYKLLDIQARDRIIHPGMTVIDLGAAPGSWSEVAIRIIGPQGRLIAVDMLPMKAISGVEFIAGDFTKSEVIVELLELIGHNGVDLVMSDMAPNMSGMATVDQLRSLSLAEEVLAFTKKILHPGGSLLLKVFQGVGLDDLVKELRSNFAKVVFRKPKASRSRSSEVYLLAKGLYNLHA